MLKKATYYYKLLPAYIAVFVLLLCSSFTYVGNVNVNTPDAFNNNYQEHVQLDKKITQQKKSNATTPAGSFVLIEEQEEDTNDNNKDNSLLLGWISTTDKHIPQSSSLVYTHSFKNCPQPISVPLYVLFHSWKSFIC